MILAQRCMDHCESISILLVILTHTILPTQNKDLAAKKKLCCIRFVWIWSIPSLFMHSVSPRLEALGVSENPIVYCILYIYYIYISDGDKKIYYHTIFIETIWYVWNYSIFVSLSPPNIFLYKSQRWEANLQEIAQKILCKSRGFLQIFPSIYIGIMINLWIHW